MAERLTEHKTTKGITKAVIKPYIDTMQPIIDKLCAFEDILEKYNIESVAELDKTLDDNQHSKKAFSKLQASETEKETWRTALEIALKENGTWWKYDNKTNVMELYYLKAKEFIKNKKSKYRKNE